MKTRTLKEIHDPYIGHKKFAKFVDSAIEEGVKITNIKEFNEKFKFEWNGYPLEFDKNPIVSVWWQYDQCKHLYEQHLKLQELGGKAK